MLLKGTICNLRSVESKDIDTVLLWENDLSLRAETEDRHIYTRSEIENFVRNQQYDIVLTEQRRFMIDTSDNRTIGAIDLFDYDAMSAKIGVLIYADSDRGKGFASEALRLLLEYARNIRLIYLQADVAADNTASRRLFVGAGFRETTQANGIVTYRLDL